MISLLEDASMSTMMRAIAGGGLAAALSLAAAPCLALSAAICTQIAETAVGVYNLAIRNGNPPADAQRHAQDAFIRRVREEGGPAPFTMEDDIGDCVAAGAGLRSLCRTVGTFYVGPPC
jgi:hypothetical protein